MSFLSIAKVGNPCLRRPNRALTPVEVKRDLVQRLIDDMIETMREAEGIGLAAPQVHENLQIVVIELARVEAEDKKSPAPLVLVNPTFAQLSEERVEGWEGCLSVDNLRGLVGRSKRVAVKYLDRRGEARTVESETFLAVVLQHELDHLVGKLYLDRMTDMTQLAQLVEYRRHVVAAPEASRG